MPTLEPILMEGSFESIEGKMRCEWTMFGGILSSNVRGLGDVSIQ